MFSAAMMADPANRRISASSVDSDRVTHFKCAPLTSLPASTDLLGFRARAWGSLSWGSVVTGDRVKVNSVKVEVH
jgi:hypothetical protein